MDKRRTLAGGLNKQTLTLLVPNEQDLRLDIRNQVEFYFCENKVMPPVSYEALVNYASMLIEKHHWEEKYRAFIMVCCGNSIWRTVVGAVPFNRRILLLPQCLKNIAFCKAELDDLGLLCRECGKCSISGFLREAENLGYVALVTEGTTVTTKLIESGKVDAIVGVGCMEVLQKMFASVSKYSIPGIGIPLLTCGCQDTQADSEWIKEEIYHYRENENIRLLNLNHLRNKTTSIFEEKQLFRFFGESKNKTEKIALESLLTGGQRLRPFLAVLAYEAFCRYPNATIVNRLALSVECFHKASLIHDDIEDNDEMRYGKETIHSRYGVPVAINAGDFLLGEGYRLLAESDLPEDIICKSMKIVSRGHKDLTIGQGDELISIRNNEILTLEEMLSVFENKTAAAFKVSILLGATIGGAEKASLETLDRFCYHIGIAYQLKDDLEDFQGDKGDIEKRKFSIFLSILSQKSNETEKQKIQKAYKSNDFQTVYEMIVQLGVQQETETLLHKHIQEAKLCLETIENLGLKLALHEILGKIFKNYI
jgi:geranylgeranyl pyrophosphate synthase